ncbi:hypothetical protein, variant 3 [Exophiala oligosperma]|uniref:C2H2-type domain-containing protein n=2 Tax=Exophiala oligosperma TaxID=215243 RepID=A0A0D2BFL8_9EURO|nr:hypothetical protein, variant 1 [Exophiala oligosperma]XP_016256513.1 hypothetical protein, variant 2 [Exophiala oligosperma]XP_016256514.1 hypothetical protein, variant 3 [Exophiala oligosperma]KIW36296.1 hypothetical protein, variant 1 [Exophiala oligosperma]KIW36297.1 hypothetical protein, variant 2 [Exophiala oligosperma]KIW36298.1 hypothetical protein, variant 3 [Exophiala oligosperma]
MPRRKKLTTVNLSSGDSYFSHTSEDVCTLDGLARKYEEALSETRPTTLYAPNTIYHVERIQRLFEEYCDKVHLDPKETLGERGTARMENFLHWLLQTFTIKKTSTVTTYWRQLSQLYIMWTQRRMDPAVMRQIFVFIEGPLTEEYGLDNEEVEKPLMEADDFVELIRYHWASDINRFPNERQRLQLAAILLLAAFTGSRPQALLDLTYGDLDLYIEKNAETHADMLRLGVKLTKTKSRQKRKRPKTYTFNLDRNPIFCPITHIVSLAFDDSAFGPPDLNSPDILFRLRARREKGCQPIPWRNNMLNVPFFRRAVATKEGVKTSPDKALTYNVYQAWVKRLGEALGYLQTLTTYCLRRALGNAINDDPKSNAAVRNLALDHVGSSTIFERNYLSRMIRYSTQDAFWNRDSDPQAAKSASRIGRLRDPNRPRKLTDEQSHRVRRLPSVHRLLESRDRVRGLILRDFGVLRMAVREPIHAEYKKLERMVNSTIRAEERALLKCSQREYDETAPVEAIQQQIKGISAEGQDLAPESDSTQIKIPERRQIAEAAMSDPAVFTGPKALFRHIKCSVTMIRLCQRRERRSTREISSATRIESTASVHNAHDLPPSSTFERVSPLTCQKHQCLFCLCSDLPQEDREKRYAGKHSLQRHAERCRLRHFQEKDRIPCPDNVACRGMVFEGKSHFKNHAASVHLFVL